MRRYSGRMRSKIESAQKFNNFLVGAGINSKKIRDIVPISINRSTRTAFFSTD
jgi:hypothetical protein